ncbi:phage tail protein [Enterococcus casseliflavus]|uniref:phage tail protein n=1 Tax=Enterococcus casseliflavus TaxID=37734 RepID=UPI003D10BCDB
MESYSVEAILSAVDKNFSSTMKNADSSMNNLDSSTQKTNTSILDIAKGIGVFKLIDNAIGLVTSSLGGAIDRFDTLNKYPVVMQALGYSAEEVDKSMNKLTDGIDGLPTSLDEIVSSAQQLAISTGDLQKGTDTAVALNNAFLASGASAADASRGAQQYQQMLSKGEVDLQSWRSLLETMPIAMDKVSKSFSDQGVNSANDLYAALKKGDITFDDFNSRLIELNEGVGGFAELAQKNSAGIRTSFANIKTAVVKGLANVITGIDEGMQDAGLGSIAENFDKIKGAVNVAFKAITDSIPPAISFLTTLWDTIKPFLPLIMAVIGYISIYQGVMGTARKAVELYNGAQKMMNVLMNLNPIGLVIAAVIALVAGFIYLWNTSEGFRNFWIGLWEGIQSVVGAAVDWIISAWNGMTEFFSNAWDGLVDGSKQAVDSVKKGWQNTKQWFADLWQGIKDSAAAMWEGTKQVFNDAVDSVVSAWNSVADWFSDLWNGIKSAISKIVGNIAEAINSRFGYLIKTIIFSFESVVIFLQNTWNNLVNIAKNVFTILKNVILAPVLFVTSLISGGWEEAKNNMIGVWNNIVEAASNIWGSFVQIFIDFFETIREIAIVLGEGFKSAINNVLIEIATITYNTWNSIKQFFSDTWESIKQGAIDAWNGLKSWLSETWNNMKQGAIDTWNSVKQFFVDLWESTKTNTINMWNAIKDGVATAWENTKNAVINTAKGIVDGAKQAWEDLKTGVSNAIEKVKETFDQIRQIDLLQIGKDIIDGLVKGIKGKIEDVKNAVKDIAGSITGKIKDILNIHSPSRVMAELGMFTSQGLADGMLDGARYVDRASSQIADRASNMDIGNRISAVNSQIQTQVQHEVSYGTNSKPALFNIQLGNQVFQAFVEDINEAQGNGINVNMQF